MNILLCLDYLRSNSREFVFGSSFWSAMGVCEVHSIYQTERIFIYCFIRLESCTTQLKRNKRLHLRAIDNLIYN